MTMHPLSLKVMTWSSALFGAVNYVLCVLYGLIAPKGLHATQLLEWLLPGFKWLSLGSFLRSFTAPTSGWCSR
jgi:hypothetical protein